MLDRLAGHPILDRLLRGRTSIAFVAFALIGIVTLQLGLLKLNSSIGRTLERESALQRDNAALSIANSELAAGEHIQSRAGQLGMEFTPVGSVHFLSARGQVDASRAAAAVRSSAAKTPTAESSESSESGEAARGSGGSSASESSSEGERTSASASESQAPAGESGGSGSMTGPSRQSGSSSEGSASQPPAAAPSPAGGGSVEATPAGGTQPGPTG